MMWGAGLVGGRPRRTARRWMRATARRPARRTSRASSCRRSTRCTSRPDRCPTAPSARRCSSEAKRLCVAYMPYKLIVHRIGTDLLHPWVLGYRRHCSGTTGGTRSTSTPSGARQPDEGGDGSAPSLLRSRRGAAVADRAGAGAGRTRVGRRRRCCATPSPSPRPASTRRRSATCTRAPSPPHIFEALYRYDHLARPAKIKPLTAPAHARGLRRLPHLDRPHQARHLLRRRPGVQGPAARARGAGLRLRAQALRRPGEQEPARAPASRRRACVGLEALREDALQTAKPFDYDRADRGRARARPLHAAVPARRAAAALHRAPRRRRASTARWRARSSSATATQIAAHPVGTGPFRLAQWRRSSRIVLERNPSYRERCYDAEPRRRRCRRPGAAGALQGPAAADGRPSRGLDHRRAAAALAGLPERAARLPASACRAEFIDVSHARTASSRPTSPSAASAACAPSQRRTARSSTSTWSDPVVGGYTPEKVALRRAINLAIDVDARDRAVRRAARRSRRSRPACRTPTGYDPNYKSEMGDYDPARAKALLDMYGYVDRDGDGWREQPDGEPLVLDAPHLAGRPAARSSTSCGKKNMEAVGTARRVPGRAVAREPEGGAGRQAA